MYICVCTCASAWLKYVCVNAAADDDVYVSVEGDVVADLFSGSGSTMIACQNTKREFTGSEIDLEYYEKSLQRLQLLSK